MGKLGINEEMLMWTSYRYCIGRSTYVNSLAPYIGQKYYDLLSEDRRAFTAKDIIECINNQLGAFGALNLHYEGSVDYDERDALSDLFEWLNENVNDDSDLAEIDTIECYKEGYGPKYPKLFEAKKMRRVALPKYEHNFDDLMVWHTLACFFNPKCHKKVLFAYDGKEEWHEVFEAWTKELESCGDGYFKSVKWKHKKCYMSVEHYKNKGSAVWLSEHFIKEVKEC